MNLLVKPTRVLLFLFLLFGGLFIARTFLAPLTFGLIIAILLNPLSKRFQGWGMPRALAVVLCVLLFVGVVAVAVSLLSWQIAGIAQDMDQIIKQVTVYQHRIQAYLTSHFGISAKTQNQVLQKQNFSSLADIRITKTIGSVASMMATCIIVLIYTFLFMYFRAHLKVSLLKFFAPDNKPRAEMVMGESANIAQQYLTGLARMVMMLWVLYGIGFSIVGIKHALFFAVLCGVLEIIPFVGNLTGCALTALMALTQGGGTSMLLWILLIYGVVQFTQSYIIEPLIVGAKVSINPLFTIISIVVGEMVWGIPGMILAIPVTGVLKLVCDNIEPLQPIGYMVGTVKRKKVKERQSEK